jgi:phosphocarrier protein HPr
MTQGVRGNNRHPRALAGELLTSRSRDTHLDLDAATDFAGGPAAQFVRWVIRFKSTITIWKGEEQFSAASLLEVLTANLDCGARVVLEAIGPDEQEAINELEALLLRFRDEEGGVQGN